MRNHKHHILRDVVMCVPRGLHRSIYHNIYTGKNMDIINDKVINWYIQRGSGYS